MFLENSFKTFQLSTTVFSFIERLFDYLTKRFCSTSYPELIPPPKLIITHSHLLQAHLRRHIQIHKRTENYNPRQRKLRNIIVQDVGGTPAENEATKLVEVQPMADYAPETAIVQESTNQQLDSPSGLASSCIMRVVIESGDAVIEEVVSNQNVGHTEVAAETFSAPEVLQQTELVSEAYESTMDMEQIVKDLSESKT